MPTIEDRIIERVANADAERLALESLTQEIHRQIRLGEQAEETPIQIRAGAWVLLDGKVKAVVRAALLGSIVLDVYGATFTIPRRLLRGHVKILGGPHA